MTSRYSISDFPSGLTLAAREKWHIAQSTEPADSGPANRVHGNAPLKKHCIDFEPLTARRQTGSMDMHL